MFCMNSLRQARYLETLSIILSIQRSKQIYIGCKTISGGIDVLVDNHLLKSNHSESDLKRRAGVSSKAFQ